MRRAHFYSAARRRVFVELPAEACTDKSKVGLLLRSMYGCRDAGVNWEFAICKVMKKFVLFKVKRPLAFTDTLKGSPVCGCMEMILFLQATSSLSNVFQKLQEFWVVTNRGILGPSGYHDCVQIFRVLGRIVEWTDEGISWEADPRHAELIRKSFGVKGRSAPTPGVKDRLDDIEGETPLADRYLANTTRAQYLSSDRREIQVEFRDLARKLQQPSNLDETGLKRLARYLGVRPRLVWLFRWQKRVTRTESLCDTDHAGCVRTRKSVSGCALMLGNSTVCTYCKGQAVIALSSGEAE